MKMTKHIAPLLASALLFLVACTSPVSQDSAVSAESSAESRALSSPVGLLKADSFVRSMNLGGLLQYEYGLQGKIIVKNLAYTKVVQLHYSVNGGAWLNLAAAFGKSLPSNQEEWNFSVSLTTIPATQAIQALNIRFAVKYQVNGQTYWDNNAGKDYFVTVGNGNSLNKLYDTAILGKDFPVSLYASYWDMAVPSNRLWQNVVQIRNFGTNQSVKIRYTLDNWATWTDAPMAKMYDFTFGSGSYWSFQTCIPRACVVSYAVCLTVDGVEYWDNNYGANYHLLFNI